MKLQMLMRQAEILHSDALKKKITIIGAGAVGSFTALSLSKMGFSNITVYDFDAVEEENMNSQFYPISSIGAKKVDVLESMVKEFSGSFIEKVPQKYIGGTFPGIVISAVDNMKTRELIWISHKEAKDTVIIDPRMGAEMAMLYVMNPSLEKDLESYPKTLYSDEDAVQERCTRKATMYTVLLIAGLVSKAVKDIVTGNAYTRIVQWDIDKNVAMGLG